MTDGTLETVDGRSARASRAEVHARYAERFGVDLTPGRRFMAAYRAAAR